MFDKPVVLIVLDGWGINMAKEANAIAEARAPIYESLLRDWPHTQLQASGEAVGLPDGQMGNSEVGHLNLGAGGSCIRIQHVSAKRSEKGISSRTLSCFPQWSP